MVKNPGRVARRKATYAAAIGSQSAWKTRLDQATPAPAARMQVSV